MIFYENAHFLSIPLHLNMCLFPEENGRQLQAFGDEYVTEQLVKNVSKKIPLLPSKQILIDFAHINLQNRKDGVFSSISQLPEATKLNLSFTNVTHFYQEKLISELKLSGNGATKTCVNISGGHEDFSMEAKKLERETIVSIIKSITIDYSERYKFLESSNIFLDKYVRIKDVFLNPAHLKILLYQLCITASKYDFDCIISASPVGAVIASCLGTLLCKPVEHLHNLGPRFAFYDRKENFKSDAKYLFVYDFICLGTEYKLINVISQIMKFNLIGGVGIASLVNPSLIDQALKEDNQNRATNETPRNLLEKITSLVYVNDSDVNIGYNIYHSQKGGLQ